MFIPTLQKTFYQNSNSGKIAAYCLDCNSKFSPVEKRKRENQLRKVWWGKLGSIY